MVDSLSPAIVNETTVQDYYAAKLLQLKRALGHRNIVGASHLVSECPHLLTQAPRFLFWFISRQELTRFCFVEQTVDCSPLVHFLLRGYGDDVRILASCLFHEKDFQRPDTSYNASIFPGVESIPHVRQYWTLEECALRHWQWLYPIVPPKEEVPDYASEAIEVFKEFGVRPMYADMASNFWTRRNFPLVRKSLATWDLTCLEETYFIEKMLHHRGNMLHHLSASVRSCSYYYQRRQITFQLSSWLWSNWPQRLAVWGIGKHCATPSWHSCIDRAED